MNQLKSLRESLESANISALRRDFLQVDLEPSIRKLKAQVGASLSSTESIDRIQKAIASFVAQKRIDDLQQARYAAFGIHMPTQRDGDSVLEQPATLAVFLGKEYGIEQWKDKPAWYRRVLQGLVISYFTFDPYALGVSSKKLQGWRKLREYLHSNIEAAKEIKNPEWLQCCIDHKSLFTDRAGESFAQKVLAGDREELNHILEQLRAKESWFPRQLVLGQVRHVVEKFDALSFRDMVDRLLDMLEEHKTVLDEGLCLLINRFAIDKNPPVHQRLKELIVLRWDNPWLQGSTKKWHPDATKASKDLVAEWLTGEFIEAFFTTLAEDADSDTRRMNFWMTYRKQMNHVRFALGTAFLESNDPDLVLLKNKMRGLYSRIKGRAKSNAFIMFMGEVIAVEFGAADNALYLYSTSTGMPFNLSDDLLEEVDGQNSLKSRRLGDNHSHKDKILGYTKWEQRIADKLFVNFGVVSDTWMPTETAPSRKSTLNSGNSRALYASTGGTPTYSATSPARITVFTDRVEKNPGTVQVGKTSWSDLITKPYSVELLEETAKVFGFAVENNKAIGGAVWVRVDSDNPTRSRVLRNWGFKYKAAKGWWR